MKTFIQEGINLTVAAPAAVSSGDGVLVGGLFGVAAADADSAADVVICTRGVFSIAKTSAQAWSQGDPIFWDDTAGEATTVSSGNTPIGYATAAAANPTATGRVAIGRGVPKTAVVQIDVPDLDEVDLAYAVAPVSGTIKKLWSVVQPDSTGSAAVAAETTITAKIGGAAVTGGVITIANASAIGAVDSAAPSAANAVTAGDLLSVESDGADTANHPATVFIEIVN